MINLKKKLQSPMVLVTQGFVVGAILFYAAQPPQAAPPQAAPAQPQPSASQALEKIVQA